MVESESELESGEAKIRRWLVGRQGEDGILEL